MQRGLDVEKAEAAMKRAAEKALYGTRAEHSGRFDLGDEAALNREAQSNTQAEIKPSSDDESLRRSRRARTI